MRFGITGFLVTLILIVLSSSPTQAQVGPARASESVGAGNAACSNHCPSFNSTTPGELSASFTSAVAIAAATIESSPVVSAYALSELESDGVDAVAEVVYSLEIVPNGKSGAPPLIGGLYVPISVFASAKSYFKYIAINPAYSTVQVDEASAGLTISDGLVSQYIALINTPTTCDNTIGAHCSGTGTDYIPPSVPNSVVLSAGCILSETIGTCSEEVDPTFSVGPAYAPYYNLVLSPNLTGKAIPEPSTWAMLIVGFAGLGLAGWQWGSKRLAAT